MQILYLNSFNTFFLDVILWILFHLKRPQPTTEGQLVSSVKSQINSCREEGLEKK